MILFMGDITAKALVINNNLNSKLCLNWEHKFLNEFIGNYFEGL